MKKEQMPVSQNGRIPKSLCIVNIRDVTFEQKKDKTGFWAELQCIVVAPDTVTDPETGKEIPVAGREFTVRAFDNPRSWQDILAAYDRLGLEKTNIETPEEYLLTGLSELKGKYVTMVVETVEDVQYATLTEAEKKEGKKPQPLLDFEGKPLSRGHKVRDWIGFSDMYRLVDVAPGAPLAQTAENRPY